MARPNNFFDYWCATYTCTRVYGTNTRNECDGRRTANPRHHFPATKHTHMYVVKSCTKWERKEMVECAKGKTRDCLRMLRKTNTKNSHVKKREIAESKAGGRHSPRKKYKTHAEKVDWSYEKYERSGCLMYLLEKIVSEKWCRHGCADQHIAAWRQERA